MNACAALLLSGILAGQIAPDDLDRLLATVRPQPGEQRFWQVPWTLTVGAAREEAARDGKPIFVWAGAGGAPIGVC